MKKLNRKQRNEIYKNLLKRLEFELKKSKSENNKIWVAPYMCIILRNEIHHLYGLLSDDQVLDFFPEILKHKPKKILKSFYFYTSPPWFPETTFGVNKRIKIVKQAIHETES